MSQRPAPRTSRSAAALFAAYGALAGAEGCAPRANTPSIADARSAQDDYLARLDAQERRRIQELPIVSVDEVRHHIYGSFDPEDPNGREIPANAAAGSELMRTSWDENEGLPEGLMAPLSPRSPEDPAPSRYQEERNPQEINSRPHFRSRERRLHEGGRSFREVLTEAIRTGGTLRVTYRSAAVHGEGDRLYSSIIFNWDTAIMEPVRTPTEITNTERHTEHVSYRIPTRLDINAALHNFCHRVTMPPNTFIHSRTVLEGRLPRARRPIVVANREAQVLLQNIEIHRATDEGQEEVWVISGDRTFIYASAPPSAGE